MSENNELKLAEKISRIEKHLYKILNELSDDNIDVKNISYLKIDIIDILNDIYNLKIDGLI